MYSPLEKSLPQAVEKSENTNLPQLVEDLHTILFSIPWGHHRYIIDKCSEDAHKALFYVRQTMENGWSRSMLLTFLGTDFYERSGKALTNFKNKNLIHKYKVSNEKAWGFSNGDAQHRFFYGL